jgi:VCBS repeat-containing protein
VNAAENQTAVQTVTGSDPDAATTLTYSITGGLDAAKFAINSNTGTLTFLTAPNFESPTDNGANNVYDVIVQVSDGTLTATKAVAVTVTNVNEAPTVTSAATVNVAENQTAVQTVTGSDPDAASALTYSISGGLDAAKFAINSTSGALTFLTAPNFESPTDNGANNVYDVTVQVSDGTLTATKAVAVTVTNVNEFAPSISSAATVSVAENQTAVQTVTGSDPDAASTLTYSISGGADAAKFAINANTGTLTFLTAPNFELPTDTGANNVYDVIVRVSDGTLTATKAVAVTVTNVNEAPTVTSAATVKAAENQTAVQTVTGSDPDAASALMYSISGGLDAARFAINATTGALTFLTAPNFESPTDSGANNVYDVTVQVSDGTLSATKAVAVTVTNVNEAPTVTSAATVNAAENQKAVQTVTGSDPDAATTLTYSISGGLDAAKFAINATTGALTFLAAPNFELPTDSGANKVYDLTVRVSDGVLTATKAVAVTVTNVNEAPTVAVPATITVTEDIKGNAPWPAALTPFADVDSPSLTVTLAVADGTISAASTANVTVGGSVTARTFKGTPAGLNAYFKTLGAISYTTAKDNTVARTLTTTVSDGSLSASALTTIAITPVNDAPTINSAAVLLGGKVGTAYEMTYATLRTSLNVADVDNASPSIVIDSVNSGTVQKWNGTAWATVSTAPTAALAQRTLSAGGKIRWLPPAGVSGGRLAFKVKAYDGSLYSAGAAQVTINLATA